MSNKMAAIKTAIKTSATQRKINTNSKRVYTDSGGPTKTIKGSKKKKKKRK